MLKIMLAVLFLAFFSCASRTQVAEVNKTAQIVVSPLTTLATGKGPMDAPANIALAKIQLQISGRIILSERCQFLKKNFDVEIWPSKASKFLYSTQVKNEGYSFDVGLPYEGNYKIQLVDARSGQSIESKNFAASKRNDRFQFDFHGCP